METLQNGVTLELAPGAFPLSTDSMVLGHFARLPRNASVLDLGAGCGTLGLMLCAKDAHCHVTGAELDPQAHAAALENIQRNGLSSRMDSLCADIRSLNLGNGRFDVCISNPPYFSGGPASSRYSLARQEDCCPPEDLLACAAHHVKYGGDVYLVHKPERMAQLIALAGKEGLEAKRLRLIRHQEGGEVTLVLLQFRKGGKPGLIWEEACLFDRFRQPTDYYREVYHL